MSKDEKLGFIDTVIPEENRNQIRVAARHYNIPADLLGYVILNELVDIKKREFVQEKVPVTYCSFGIAQIQVQTAIDSELIPNVTNPKKVKKLLIKNDTVSIRAAAKYIDHLISSAGNHSGNVWQKQFGSPSENDLRDDKLTAMELYMIVAAYNSPDVQIANNPGPVWDVDNENLPLHQLQGCCFHLYIAIVFLQWFPNQKPSLPFC